MSPVLQGGQKGLYNLGNDFAPAVQSLYVVLRGQIEYYYLKQSFKPSLQKCNISTKYLQNSP